MAANADTNGIERVNYLALLALGIFYFLCAFLPIYFGAEHAKTAIDVLPERLIDGLGVAGGIMPAIGFAVLLKIMMKNVYIPYFIIGFVAAAWLKLPVLAIAGSLVSKKIQPTTSGTLPTHGALFIGLLAGTVLLVGALTFIPALALGPVAEYLSLR